MLLEINNFAKIKNASISLDSITAIAGLNNTGKSTVGKLLYCLINSFESLDSKILIERSNRINKILNNNIFLNLKSSTHGFRSDSLRGEANRLYNDLESLDEIYRIDLPSLEKMVDQLITKHFDQSGVYLEDQDLITKKTAAELFAVYSINRDDLEKIILSKQLVAEFNNQFSNISDKRKETLVKLNIDGLMLNICIKDNKVLNIERNCDIKNNAIMIDNPFIIEQGPRFNHTENHSVNLHKMLSRYEPDSITDAFNELITDRKLAKVMEKLSSVVQGSLIIDKNGDNVYEESPGADPIYISNLSTGLKTFIIIKKLIQNNYLNENSILILDEPEIHLHPEWQLVYAELMVLLNIELGIKIVITTHSPYFLNAIEVFSRKHQVDSPKFYLSESFNNLATFKDVTDNLEEIYSLLAKPFQILENLALLKPHAQMTHCLKII